MASASNDPLRDPYEGLVASDTEDDEEEDEEAADD